MKKIKLTNTREKKTTNKIFIFFLCAELSSFSYIIIVLYIFNDDDDVVVVRHDKVFQNRCLQLNKRGKMHILLFFTALVFNKVKCLSYNILTKCLYTLKMNIQVGVNISKPKCKCKAIVQGQSRIKARLKIVSRQTYLLPLCRSK